MKKKGVRLKEVKTSGYICPVCKDGELIEIKNNKILGHVKIKFRTKDGIGFDFACEVKNDYFFLCKSETCRARFERGTRKEGEKKVGPLCPIVNCPGSLDTYTIVPVAKIHPDTSADAVVLISGKKEPNYFKIVEGELSFDEAGICTRCHYIGAKEIDLK
jgi:hypothetical protein